MGIRPFVQMDVFAERAGRGNGLAVVAEAAGLSDADMQAFAAWTNLAETTFLLPPDDPAADYRVRIFTPQREMPFAGHPTLGSCAAWQHLGGRPKLDDRVVQECAIGLVEIDQTGALPAFVAPPTAIRPMAPALRDHALELLGLAPGDILAAVELENGPVWQLFELRSAGAVLALDAGAVTWAQVPALAVVGPHAACAGAAWEQRLLSPSSGMSEDPVTGSLAAAVARWLDDQGRLGPEAVVAQGGRIGRDGRIHLRRDPAGRVLVGGRSHVVIAGTVDI
ncbi:PhzF family phenazine biosynthesis protein [Roseisalinus antarcticus]|uniref:Trans-2,3-dihydro-3-hydroxyanthranilate isomerase n=1 Tax=Roseisalinus antarcticus TaxID=254357 RepID=A0A1Y5RKN3_9RHOB|nr:PhzF family phenazine biosynthesis protein [Roseisalinus antarcticus]SLN19437.1 Trans-2,3-dihydro-3-hydroxyanthranilate isomerase [Roseisalinus antarcticus]